MHVLGYINDLRLNYIKGSNIFPLLKYPYFYKPTSTVKVTAFSAFHANRDVKNCCWYIKGIQSKPQRTQMHIHTHKASIYPQTLLLFALITPNILCTFLFLSSLTANNFKYCIQTASKYMNTFPNSYDAFFSQRCFFLKLILFYRYSITAWQPIMYENTSININGIWQGCSWKYKVSIRIW